MLDQLLLIGSWCAGFYKNYFENVDYNPVIKTRDIDFLISHRSHFAKSVDLEELLKPLGFEIEFFGKGFMKLESDELIIEFLIPEIGRPKEKPHPLPQLHFNAQPLRHLSILWRDPITVNVEGIKVRLPHPADFCLQKLVVAPKRKKSEKSEKDLATAFEVLNAILQKGELKSFSLALKDLTPKERAAAIKALEKGGYGHIISKANQ